MIVKILASTHRYMLPLFEFAISTGLYVAHIIFRNIEDFLPINTSEFRSVKLRDKNAKTHVATCKNKAHNTHMYTKYPNTLRTNVPHSKSRAESLVLSSQLGRLDKGDIPGNLFRGNPITLKFTFPVCLVIVLFGIL